MPRRRPAYNITLLHYMAGEVAPCQSHELTRKLQSVNEQFLTDLKEDDFVEVSYPPVPTSSRAASD